METGSKFDPKTQKVVKVVPADNEAQDGQVAQVLKRGFMRGDRIIRSEEVILRKLGAKADPEAG